LFQVFLIDVLYLCRNNMFHRECEQELWTSWEGLLFALLASQPLICDRMLTLFLVFVFHFSTVSVDEDLGFKAQSNYQEEHKCAFSTWWAWLGLPLDLLISAIGKIWEGWSLLKVFLPVYKDFFNSRPYMWTKNDFFNSLCKYDLWRIRLGFRLRCLPIDIFGLNLGFRAHIACLVDFFSCPRRRRFGAGGPVFSTTWSWLSRI